MRSYEAKKRPCDKIDDSDQDHVGYFAGESISTGRIDQGHLEHWRKERGRVHKKLTVSGGVLQRILERCKF